MMGSNVKILLYVTRLLFPRFPAYLFPLCMLAYYNRFQKMQKLFVTRTIPRELMEEILINQNVNNDVAHTVIISQQHSKEIGINGKFAKLIDNETEKPRQTVFVVALNEIDENVILMSNTLKFNLGIKTDKVRLRPVLNVCFATELNLSLINASNVDVNNCIVDYVVGNYFKTPKLVHKGDVIDVAVSQFGKEFFYASLKARELHTLHFKCNQILLKGKVVGGALCVVGKTCVKQSANIQGFVAPVLKTWTGKMWDLIDVCPGGLEDCLEVMEKTVMPFIEKRKLQVNPVFLLQGCKGTGKSLLLVSVAKKLGMHLLKVSSSELSGTTYAQTETKMQNLFFKAALCTPCILAINNFENYGRNNEGQHDQRIMEFFKVNMQMLFKTNSFPLILICVSNSKDIPSELSRVFLQTIHIDIPNDQQRLKMLEWILKCFNLEYRGCLEKIAEKTRGFVLEDLKALVFYSQKNSAFCQKLSENGFEQALDVMQINYSRSVGAPSIPKVQWEDVGGLTDVKKEIISTINMPLKHPQLLRATGLKRSGILLYGPPGTGKTLIAKAVATECNMCFLSVKGPELLNMYVGQSEHNVRKVFEGAREASPCIIFFDELDSLAPNRGASGDSGGVMDRVVSQLLAEMDGLDQSSTIFIIGATNRPDLIDSALLRPGRFDKLLYVGPCTDTKSKIAVLEALTRKFKLGEDINLQEIITMCPVYVTGADLYGLCAGAWMSAVRKLIKKINDAVEHKNDPILIHSDVVVTLDDFKISIVDLQTSVKVEDLQYFEKLRHQLKV